MSEKVRILFSIEIRDAWILRAYKSFFDSLAGRPYEVLCTTCDVDEPAQHLAAYNIVDYAKISRGTLGSFADEFASAPPKRFVEQSQKLSIWESPEVLLRRFAGFRQAFRMIQPDVVIVWNGMADIRRMIKEFLSENGAPFFYAEKGMLHNSWYIDEVGINARSSLEPSAASGALCDAERDRIESYILDIINSGSSGWEQPDRVSVKTLRDKFSVRAHSPVIFFPGQVDEDTNITEFSRFKSVVEAVSAVAEVMPAEATLVVKPHPKAMAESRQRLEQLAGQFPNLRIVTDVNVWDIIEIAELVVSINSTVAFESLLRKRKLLLLGDSVLSKVGLVGKTEVAELRAATRKGLDDTFDSRIDYPGTLSFVKFLLDNYYLFSGTPSVPQSVLSRIDSRASRASGRIFSVKELMEMFYHGEPVIVSDSSATKELGKPADRVIAETSSISHSVHKVAVGTKSIPKGLSILHTVEFYHPHLGGSEEVIRQLSEHLVLRGYDVTVATSKLPERTFGELNGVKIEEFDVSGSLVRGFKGSDVARYREFLLKHPADVMMNYAAQQWATDLAYETLNQTNDRRVHIIAPCGFSALKDACTLAVPEFKDYFARVIPMYLPKYDAAVYHSATYQDYQFAQNHNFANSVVIPNGACEQEFSREPKVDFRRKYHIATKYFGLCVANFYGGKGHERVIECVRQMNRPDFTMVFIGIHGGGLPKLRQLASGLNVKFCVGIGREDVLAAYHQADIFLLGSEKECSPLVILEAKASRLPFVSTDCGNVREWTGGVVCLPEKMAYYANRMLDDDEIRKTLAEEGFRQWKEKFTWDSIVNRYEELYLSLHQKKTGAKQLVSYAERPQQTPRMPQDQAKTSKPKFSIVMANYNNDRFVAQAIESVLNQTFKEWELIIVDDCSTDDSVDIIKRYLTDDRIRLTRHDINNGYITALKTAIAAVNSELFGILDSDDSLAVHAVETMYKHHMQSPDCGFIYSHFMWCGANLRPLRGGFCCELPPGMTALDMDAVSHFKTFKLRDYLKTSGYDETMLYAEDKDIIYKMEEVTRLKFVPDCLYNYRELQLSQSHDHRKAAVGRKSKERAKSAARKRRGQDIHSLYERHVLGKSQGNPYLSAIPLYQAKDNPLVLIWMAVYNGADYIARAIESVLIQNYRNFELIVVDDGSMDHSAAIVRSFKDEPIKYFLKEHGGLASARNVQMKKSAGSFIIILDSDDMMTPDFIARHLQTFEQHPEADLVYCDDYLIDEDDDHICIINRPEYKNQSLLIYDIFRCGLPVVPFGTCIRKSAFDKIGHYDERLIIGEDCDMMRRFIKQGLRIHRLPEALYLRRLSENSRSRNFNADKAKSQFEAIRRFTETFTPEQLFPDVRWNRLPDEQKILMAKYRTAIVYVNIGNKYFRANAPACASLAYDMACTELDDCCKIAPNYQPFADMREKCRFIRATRLPSGRRPVHQLV